MMWIGIFSFLALASFSYYGFCCTRVSRRSSILYFWLLLGGFFLLSAVSRRFFCLLSIPFFLFWLLFFAFLLAKSRPTPRTVAKPELLILLGARSDGTLPSEIIEDRVRVAAELMKRDPELTCILSGGRVFGEGESEAETLKKALLRHGISSHRLCTEEKSRTTAENFRYALALAGETRRIGVVTSNYHLYRARCTALTAHPTGEMMFYAAAAPAWFLPHLNIREFFTFSVELLRGNLSFIKNRR